MIARVVIAALLGVLTWTFLEYVIHRWMGHDRRFRKTPFGVEHVRHHAEGDYFAPTWKKLTIAAVLVLLLSAPAVAVAGVGPGIAFVAGLMGFYGVYEVTHRREHTHAGFGPYGRWARRHHFYHHFVDGRMNHGVTSPLWDFVFGTYRQPTIVKVPARLCMRWLKDPRTGDVAAQHAHTFVLAVPPKALFTCEAPFETTLHEAEHGEREQRDTDRCRERHALLQRDVGAERDEPTDRAGSRPRRAMS